MKRHLIARLTAQRRQLRLRDGRQLGYAIYGAPYGRPVYFFHGFPGSHEQAAMVQEHAAAAGVALVAFDRPGFGDSSPAPGAGIDTIVADVDELSRHLGHARFAAVGISCGGPYALACARLLHGRVSGVGLLGGIAPMDRAEVYAGQHPMLRLLFSLARRSPRLISPLLCLDWLMFRSSPQRAVKALAGLLTPPDRALLAADERVSERFGISLSRAYAQGIGGAMHEAARIARLRSDSLDGIKVPVHVYQAGHDRNVPRAMGAWQARRLARAELHACPDDGHLSIVVNRFTECIARLLRRDADGG